MKNLTPAQIEILTMLSTGMSIKQIVYIRSTTVRTVYDQIYDARERLGANTNYEMIAVFSRRYRLRIAGKRKSA